MTPKSPFQIASFEAAKTASFSQSWRALAHSRLLPFLLLALGTVSSGVYAHAPLDSFAAMSGITLPRHRAITIALSIWLVNQIIGFTFRDYPLTGTAFMWGLLMGIGTLLTVIWASLRPAFSRTSWSGHFSWEIISIVIGFVLYQGLILLAYPLMADGHTMSWDIVASIFSKQVMWAGAISLGHAALLWRQMTWLSPTQS
ncbi:MAG: hypothetical protein AAGF98_00680 [Cyanobacteria bacterium P01_H01_bin.153]